ncbi:MAG: Rieske 2Fe-2S domain-containing protein [Deltaproteobacteria bacterium]|nr:Rieske 2Fe-2S domain-containing protein [Deltaproteobacteria bacterium]
MNMWQCAGWSDEVTDHPVGRTLLNRRIVMFRDANGTARTVGARCPHRGADLASGTVVDGCIECPFHGWRFDGDGQCVRVPSQPATVKIPPHARVPAFPLLERNGVLWVWMSAGEIQLGVPPSDAGGIQRGVPVPDPPATAGRNVRRIFFPPQLIAAPILRTLENAFDEAHLPFIHRKTFGADRDPLVERKHIAVDPDGGGLVAQEDPDSPWHTAPTLPRGWVGVLAAMLGLRAPVARYVRFELPCVNHVYLEYPNGTYDLFVTYLTPADDAHTWLFVSSARTRAPHALGDWIQRRVLARIFAEGSRETTLILAAGSDSPPRQVSVESDRTSLRVRQLYERWDEAPQAPRDDGGARAQRPGEAL